MIEFGFIGWQAAVKSRKLKVESWKPKVESWKSKVESQYRVMRNGERGGSSL